MISTFDIAKLNNLLEDFYNLTHIRITIFDESFKELAAYPTEIAPVCQIIRSDKQAEAACRACDATACRLAVGRHSPYVYLCHAGLTECITPLYLGGIVIGYLLFGHIFSYSSFDEGWKSIHKLCSDYQIDFDRLFDACKTHPMISKGYILSASHILQAVASYLCMERMVTLKTKNLPVQIDEFISNHYTEDINVSQICNKFSIGKTALYEIANQNYGVGIAEHIRNLRIEKAKLLLMTQPEMPISEIASLCGFVDYNYFITLFKKKTGSSPKKYQKGQLYAKTTNQ